MIIIDTSVWISFFNDNKSKSANFVDDLVTNHHSVCINAIIEMEILHGVKDESLYVTTRHYLSDFQYFPDMTREYFHKAAEIYRACRKNGVTIRKSLDCLIAANALIDNLHVAHLDRDFELISRVFPDLRTTNVKHLVAGI